MRPTVSLPIVLVVVLACAPKPAAGPPADSSAAAADSTVAAPAATPGVPLEGTAWRLVELDGKAVTAPADSARAPGLTLLVDGHKVQGSAGCNRMMGSYQLSGSSLKFGPLATTRMACPGMDAEQAYLKALGATTRYEIVGTTLTLFGAEGALARLEAPAPA
jgi:copper homeostasis protein (lipoprotein)